SPAALSAQVPSAIGVAGDAREVTSARADRHSLTAEDAANSSGAGGAH
ncbi:hypothetical protein N307_01813, partial [Dryobates pubescens]